MLLRDMRRQIFFCDFFFSLNFYFRLQIKVKEVNKRFLARLGKQKSNRKYLEECTFKVIGQFISVSTFRHEELVKISHSV